MDEGEWEAKEKAMRVKMERMNHQSTESESWSKNYERWNDWMEVEDHQQAMEKRRKDKDNKERRERAMGGCNHDHSAERELMEKSTQVKINECWKFKNHGNSWFQEGQYFRAGELYRKIIVWLDYTFAEHDEEQKVVDEIHLYAYVNLGICKLKLKDYSSAFEYARLAIGLDEGNVKALHCLAKSCRQLDRLEEAATYIMRAIDVEPNNFEIRKEVQLLKNKQKRYKLDTTMRAKAMFAGEAIKKTISDSKAYEKNVIPLLGQDFNTFNDFVVDNIDDESETL